MRQEPGLPAGTHVLDVGSGPGAPARYLAETHGRRVTAIDVTGEYVEVVAAGASTVKGGRCWVRGQAQGRRRTDATRRGLLLSPQEVP